MKASRLHRGQPANDRLADDVLTITALEARLFGHAGFPEAADALAYDAVQRILAVCPCLIPIMSIYSCLSCQ